VKRIKRWLVALSIVLLTLCMIGAAAPAIPAIGGCSLINCAGLKYGIPPQITQQDVNKVKSSFDADTKAKPTTKEASK